MPHSNLRYRQKVLPSGLSRLRLTLLVAFLVIISLTGYSLWVQHVTAATRTQESEQLHQAAALHRADEAFGQAEATITGNYPGLQMAVAVATDQSGVRNFGDSSSFDAASTAKVLTAAAFLHRVDQGQASLQQSLEGQSAIYWLRAMLIESDDQAWQVMNDYLGHAYLLSYARSQNLFHYDPDGNTITARDMALLLVKLANGTLLSSRRQLLLMSLMQKANYRDYIVPSVPIGWNVAHKAGFTDGNIHDVAIVSKGDLWIVLSIYTNGDDTYTSVQRAAAIQSLSKAAFTAYL